MRGCTRLNRPESLRSTLMYSCQMKDDNVVIKMSDEQLFQQAMIIIQCFRNFKNFPFCKPPERLDYFDCCSVACGNLRSGARAIHDCNSSCCREQTRPGRRISRSHHSRHLLLQTRVSFVDIEFGRFCTHCSVGDSNSDYVDTQQSA